MSRTKSKTRGFFPMIRSRHPSHDNLRRSLKRMPFRSVIRFGSTTPLSNIPNSKERIEINTPEAVKNSSSKIRMKRCFDKGNVKTARWWKKFSNTEFIEEKTGEITNINDMPLPIVMKREFGSRGNENRKIDTLEELKDATQGRPMSNYIFEKFINYTREYRLHVTKEGCFHTCRKLLKQDTPKEDKWFRNDKNCVWYVEENPKFDKPINWDEIVNNCVKALISTGLDFGAVDLKVQSSTYKNGNKRNKCEFFVIEINSAPSFGDITVEKYKEELPKLLEHKWKNS